MIVREVRLENIKSYGSPPEVIRFVRGVNAISGQNGAGKSTVLEAIGSALFQHLPYRHQSFVREGESTGTITVVVDSRFDGRTYEVVRRVGKGPSHYVYDLDLKQQIARGEADVGRWLRQHLGVDPDIDLQSLFVDTVGPPQGTLTAIFLASAGDRRVKFDRLLRVDEYKEASDKLKLLETAIDAERQDLSVRIAVLDGQTRGRADLEFRSATRRDELAGLGVRLGRLTAEREALDRVLAAFEEASRRWQSARSALEVATERERSAAGLFARIQGEVDAARAAIEVCARTRHARDTYLDAERELAVQESRRDERDRLRVAKHGADLDVGRLTNEVERLEVEIRRGEAAREQIDVLKARIPDQEAAEARLEAARNANREIDDLKKRLADIRDRGTRAADRSSRADKALDRTETVREIASDLEARRRRHIDLANIVAAIHRADGEVVSLQSGIQEEKRRQSLAGRRVAELEAQLRDAAFRSESAMALATLEMRFRALTEERAAAASHLSHARTTRKQVSSGVCPFLREPCRNLRPGVTLDAYFDEEARTWSGKLGVIESEFTDVERQLQDARAFELRRVQIDTWRADREALQDELTEGFRRLSALEARYLEASAHIAGRADAVRAEQAATAEIRVAEGASQELGRLPQLQQEAQEARDELIRARAEWTATKEKLAGSEALEAELLDATSEAERIGRPREAIAVLLPDAARVPSLLANRDLAVAESQRARREASELEALQRPFADIDRRIAESRATREATRPDYESYLAAIPLAEQLDARLNALADADRVLQEAMSRTALTRAEVDRAAADYDEDAHLINRRRRADLGTEIGQTGAQIELANDDVQRLETELATIATLERELATLREAAERLDEERNLAGSIRQAVRSTGPEITRRLLSSISRLASSINAEILSQAGIELEWTADYEIVTRRHGESRAFAQLSGGEQMAAALAVRMAAMRLLSNVRVAFLDEPTAHLDQSRRANLGDQVQHLQGFDQLVVISHDDTFDGLFGHLVRINLQDGRSRVANES